MRVRRHLNLANVLATSALVVTLTGTSYAAITLRGTNVKDGTLTSADFKFGSLTSSDLSSAAKASLKGPQGDPGNQGSKGSRGATGPKGDPGPPGANANTRATFASWDAGYIDTTNPGLNSGLQDWHSWAYGGGCAAPDCHLSASAAGNAKSLAGAADGSTIVDLDTIAPASGGGGSNAGRLATAWQHSTLMAWGNATLMYRTESDAAPLHTRAECWMSIGGQKAGPSTFVSAATQRELKTIFVVGNAKVGPGTYNAAVVCRDADATTGHTRWQAVRANVTMLANEQV